MKSSRPTYPSVPNPYPPTDSMAPRPQQPLGFVNTGYQEQRGQVSFYTSPEIFSSNQLGQGNPTMINPAIGTAVTNLKEGKSLGFIVSGVLSIAASKEFSPCQIKGTLGMNIVSAIFVLAGVILLLFDMSINSLSSQDYWAVVSGRGISGMLTIFSLLEFSIACTTAHFANQTIICASRSVLVVPTVFTANPLTQESSTVPPRYGGLPAYAPRP
ncbi:membrane-spanning 4-domains subfamily A member 12 [Nannospalax galili]|uniref:membrane-spanning 4-domains subfamily A member 12 n=1 Tax=Nannospalax galili TaxID=1026970 RepID=UPI0004ED519F|nr:membrane-spanning 4-domains subfamily A member 12 [Nannospalax galili]